MKFVARMIIVLSSSLLLFLACNEDPGLVGSGLVPIEDIPEVFEFDSRINSVSQKLNFYKPDSFDIGTSSKIFLGKNNGLTSSVLLKFTFFLDTSIINAINENNFKVLSAKIKSTPNETYGDPNAGFDFEAYKVNAAWGTRNYTKDSLDLLDVDYSSDISFEHEINDTSVTFKLNEQLVEEWLQNRVDDDNPQFANHGMLLKPTANSDRIIGLNAISVNLQSSIFFDIEIELRGSSVDTVSAIQMLDVHVLDGEIDNSNENVTILSSGISQRGNLFFDLSGIPKNSVVTESYLELFVDSSASFQGSIDTDSIDVFSWSDSLARELDGSSGVLLSKNASGDMYSGNITKIVQTWLNNNDNQGLRLSLPEEVNSLNRLAIKNHNADKDLQPRIKLKYIMFKEGK